MRSLEELALSIPAGHLIVPVMFESDDNIAELTGKDPTGIAGYLILNADQIVSYNESAPNTTIRMSDGSLITVYMDIIDCMDAVENAKETINLNVGIN